MDLPEEIQLEIAKSVDNKDLARCRQVSKLWMVTLSPLCYARLPIFKNMIYITEIQFGYLCNILQHGSADSISLSFASGRFKDSLALIGHVKNLRSLKLRECSLDDYFLDTLGMFCQNLTALTITVAHKSKFVQDLHHLEYISTLTTLKELNLFGYLLTPSYTRQILEPLVPLPNLEIMPQMPISTIKELDIVDRMVSKQKLSKIWISNNPQIQTKAFDVLSQMTGLTDLSISDLITTESIRELTTLVNLKKVKLQSSVAGAPDVMKNWPNLEACSLQIPRINRITGSDNLTRLSFKHCIVEGGFSSLQKLTNLRRLTFATCNLTEDDLPFIPVDNLTVLKFRNLQEVDTMAGYLRKDLLRRATNLKKLVLPGITAYTREEVELLLA